MALRVWWIPQIPMNPFHVEVESTDEAILMLNTLAAYDLFQYEIRIKGDYANMGGLEYWNEEENDWNEWYCMDEKNQHYGMDINEIMREAEGLRDDRNTPAD